MAVTKQIQKWGNSLAFRIPKSFAEELDIEEGSEVELRVVSGQLVAVPKTLTLEELVNGITEENRHKETKTGDKKGAEVW